MRNERSSNREHGRGIKMAAEKIDGRCRGLVNDGERKNGRGVIGVRQRKW